MGRAGRGCGTRRKPCRQGGQRSELSQVLGPDRGHCPRVARPPGRDSLAQHQLAEGRRGARAGRGRGGCGGQGAGRGGWAGRCPAALRDQPAVGHVLAGGGHGAVRLATVIRPVVGAGAWDARLGRSPLGPGWVPSCPVLTPFTSSAARPPPHPPPPWRLLCYDTGYRTERQLWPEVSGRARRCSPGGGDVARGRRGGGTLGAREGCGGRSRRVLPWHSCCVPTHRTGPRCCSRSGCTTAGCGRLARAWRRWLRWPGCPRASCRWPSQTRSRRCC